MDESRNPASLSLTKVFRTVLYVSVAVVVAVLTARRWTSSFLRFRAFSRNDVSSLLAPEPSSTVAGASSEGEAKKPREVVFSLEAPGAKTVLLGGSFNGFDARKHPLSRGQDGVWETVLSLGPGRYIYKFKVDGKWILDPSNPESTSPPRQASVLEIQ